MINPIQDRVGLTQALRYADESPDPSTKIGAILLCHSGWGARGFNTFPEGVAVTEARLGDRALKLQLMVHAEMAAVLRAAAGGYRTQDSTLFFAARDAHDATQVWGGAPCVRCAVELIAAGVKRVVSPSSALRPQRWAEDCALGAQVLREAGVSVEEIEL
jgi:dCMP deaminase